MVKTLLAIVVSCSPRPCLAFTCMNKQRAEHRLGQQVSMGVTALSGPCWVEAHPTTFSGSRTSLVLEKSCHSKKTRWDCAHQALLKPSSSKLLGSLCKPHFVPLFDTELQSTTVAYGVNVVWPCKPKSRHAHRDETAVRETKARGQHAECQHISATLNKVARTCLEVCLSSESTDL